MSSTKQCHKAASQNAFSLKLRQSITYTHHSMSKLFEILRQGERLHAWRAGNSVGRTLSIGAIGVKENLG